MPGTGFPQGEIGEDGCADEQEGGGFGNAGKKGCLGLGRGCEQEGQFVAVVEAAPDDLADVVHAIGGEQLPAGSGSDEAVEVVEGFVVVEEGRGSGIAGEIGIPGGLPCDVDGVGVAVDATQGAESGCGCAIPDGRVDGAGGGLGVPGDGAVIVNGFGVGIGASEGGEASDTAIGGGGESLESAGGVHGGPGGGPGVVNGVGGAPIASGGLAEAGGDAVAGDEGVAGAVARDGHSDRVPIGVEAHDVSTSGGNGVAETIPDETLRGLQGMRVPAGLPGTANGGGPSLHRADRHGERRDHSVLPKKCLVGPIGLLVVADNGTGGVDGGRGTVDPGGANGLHLKNGNCPGRECQGEGANTTEHEC